MFLKECTTQEYIENTLDPIPARSLFCNDQYFYYLCLKQRYSHTSCPSYLTEDGFNRLKVKIKILRPIALTEFYGIYLPDFWSFKLF